MVTPSISKIIFPTPIYNFLVYTNRYKVERTVLDCGAGGSKPPLALFYIHGYKTYGIDISDTQINRALDFSSRYNVFLKIKKGDMRQIPFPDEKFGCVFSWNSSIHLTKKDTELAVREMLRVLRNSGLLYLNFIWDEAQETYARYGKEGNPGEYWMEEAGEEVVHSVFSEQETDRLLNNVEVLYKEKRHLTLKLEGGIFKDGYLDYIVRK